MTDHTIICRGYRQMTQTVALSFTCVTT